MFQDWQNFARNLWMFVVYIKYSCSEGISTIIYPHKSHPINIKFASAGIIETHDPHFRSDLTAFKHNQNYLIFLKIKTVH